MIDLWPGPRARLEIGDRVRSKASGLTGTVRAVFPFRWTDDTYGRSHIGLSIEKIGAELAASRAAR